jgi:toxin ParE1/3/4
MGRNKKEVEEKKDLIFPFEFHPQVEFDLLDAQEYYEERRPGLGYEFLLSVEASLNYISRHPLHFQKVFSQTRHAIIKRFPFGIFYIIANDKIYISAIIQLSRDPKRWKNRKR